LTEEKTKLKKETGTQLTLVTKSLSILAGVALALPPYLHIFLDRDSTEPLFGYYNARIFWLDSGQAFSLFFVSIILLLLVSYPTNKPVKHFAKNSVFSFLITGAMFSIKPFIPRNDFNIWTYYIALFVASTILALGLFWFIKQISELRKKKINAIFNFLVERTWSAEKGIIYKALMAGFHSSRDDDASLSDYEADQQKWEDELDDLIQKYG